MGAGGSTDLTESRPAANGRPPPRSPLQPRAQHRAGGVPGLPEQASQRRLQLMQAITVLLPWSVELSLHGQLDAEVRAHVVRVGRRLLLPGR